VEDYAIVVVPTEARPSFLRMPRGGAGGIVGVTMPSARLSPLDATFLHVEDDVSHMHIGSVGIFEGPAPGHAELLAAVARKLDRVPRFRQKVRFVPLAAGRPVWVDDPHFQLGYHVRRTALPSPGGDEELHRLIGRLMSVQLDRARPLWEVWAAEGLEEGRWALITKLHHCMADGVSASSLITALMDTTRDPPRLRPAAWTPDRSPRDLELIAGALANRAGWPLRVLRTGAAVAREPVRSLTHAAATVQGLAEYAGIVRLAPGTTLNGPIGPHRRWDVARARLHDVKEIREGLGGTVNDVVLAVIAGGFRALLDSRGERVDGPLRSLVPVSLRPRDAAGPADNRVSAIFADLPVDLADPVARLHRVAAQMSHLKHTNEAVAGEALTAFGGVVPELLLSWSGRVATRTPQRNVVTVTTNVPGPQHSLYFSTRRMLEVFPYVPLAGHVRVGVAIYSYDGGLGFGVTGDYDTAPDIGVLCAGIEREVDRLLAAAHDRPRHAPPPPAPAEWRRRGEGRL
jgi:WS/DGAT/MGAT family acyltransferase